jgi:hypothetical protein
MWGGGTEQNMMKDRWNTIYLNGGIDGTEQVQMEEYVGGGTEQNMMKDRCGTQ